MPNCVAIDLLDTPEVSKHSTSFFLFRYCTSLDEDPGGRPSLTPAFFFAARASLVRCEIRFLSIAAASEKAKAIILALRSSDKSKWSLIEWICMPFVEHIFRMDITIIIFLPSRDNSVQSSIKNPSGGLLVPANSII